MFSVSCGSLVWQASQESRAAPAVFTATPAAAQQAQHAQQPQHAQQAQQAQPGTSSQHPGDTQDTSAPATAPAQGGDEPTPLPQRAAFPRTPQTLAGGPESPTVHKSAESIVAKEPVKAASKAGAKGRLARGSDDREDVELTPEELGFAGHSDDAFAGSHHRNQL